MMKLKQIACDIQQVIEDRRKLQEAARSHFKNWMGDAVFPLQRSVHTRFPTIATTPASYFQSYSKTEENMQY